jgi:DNA repair protein RadC
MAIAEIEATYIGTGKTFCDASVTRAFCRLQIATEPVEVFGVLFLTTQNELIKFERMFNGTIDRASVYPREIVRRALELHANGIIVTHNHPSGCVNPSRSDHAITKQIKQACDLFDIVLLDHVIVSVRDSLSFVDSGITF